MSLAGQWQESGSDIRYCHAWPVEMNSLFSSLLASWRRRGNQQDKGVPTPWQDNGAHCFRFFVCKRWPIPACPLSHSSGAIKWKNIHIKVLEHANYDTGIIALLCDGPLHDVPISSSFPIPFAIPCTWAEAQASPLQWGPLIPNTAGRGESPLGLSWRPWRCLVMNEFIRFLPSAGLCLILFS